MRIIGDLARAARRRLLAGAAATAMIATALVVGLATPAQACTCVATDLKTQAKQGDAVFVGTPVEVTDDGGDLVYDVRVSDVYSGTADPVTTVRTAESDAACGADLELDKQYMFVGEQKQAHGDVSTTGCSGTQPISDEVIQAVEKALGPATPYRGTSGDDGRDQGGGDNSSDNDGNGSSNASGDDAASDGTTASDSEQESSDDGNTATYATVGVVLAVAIGASFLLPRLRRRSR
ncbi:hypothetical protein MU582_10410 [Nocardioidaceae bacterium SCSIO 66511]|nr:hypothetical protein MU582_10410 [Nocardioidaceae bacterium SCSIO 66511]